MHSQRRKQVNLLTDKKFLEEKKFFEELEALEPDDGIFVALGRKEEKEEEAEEERYLKEDEGE